MNEQTKIELLKLAVELTKATMNQNNYYSSTKEKSVKSLLSESKNLIMDAYSSIEAK